MNKPVHVEDGGEIVRIPIKEILWSISRSELIAEGEDLVDGFSSHQLTKSSRNQSFKNKVLLCMFLTWWLGTR